MRTDLETLREALRQIAESYPATEEGETLASMARAALDEVADREQSRAAGLPVPVPRA
jgi:ABC-type hemin transport system substrate-binding protein